MVPETNVNAFGRHIFFPEIMELQLRGHQISVRLFTENVFKFLKKIFGMFLAQTGSVKRHERQNPKIVEIAESRRALHI